MILACSTHINGNVSYFSLFINGKKESTGAAGGQTRLVLLDKTVDELFQRGLETRTGQQVHRRQRRRRARPLAAAAADAAAAATADADADADAGQPGRRAGGAATRLRPSWKETQIVNVWNEPFVAAHVLPAPFSFRSFFVLVSPRIYSCSDSDGMREKKQHKLFTATRQYSDVYRNKLSLPKSSVGLMQRFLI